MMFRSAALFLLLASSIATGAGARDWRTLAWPQDVDRIERAVTIARSSLPTEPNGDEAATLAIALLARARQPMPLGTIEGRWLVRSIQMQGATGYAYPFFNAKIARQGREHRFIKTTGSQRRNGVLLGIDLDKRALAFIGESTVNDDPIRGYGRLAGSRSPDPSNGDGSGDSVGRLIRIGPSELLMILDADTRGYELYHLKR